MEDSLPQIGLKTLAAKGGGALFLRHLCGFTVNFIGGIILARHLGPEILGLYFISFSILVVLRELVDFGVATHFIRLPHDPTPSELRTAFIFQQSVGGILLLAGAVLFRLSIGTPHEELLILVASAFVGAYFYSWQSIPVSSFERRLDYYRVGMVEVADIASFNVIAVLLTMMGYGIWGLVIANMARGIVPATLATFMLGLSPHKGARLSSLKDLLLQTTPFLGAKVSVWAVILAPSVLLSSLAGSRAFGIAQLSHNVMGTIMVVPMIFQRVSLSALSRIQEDREAFNRAVGKSLLLLSMVCIPLITGVSSFSPLWVPFLYGEKWIDMSGVVLLSVFPFMVASLLSIPTSALMAKGYPSIVFKQNVLHGVLFWVVMLITAPLLKELAMPVTYLVSLSSAYLVIKGYMRYCGRLDTGYFLILLLLAGGTTVLSWYLNTVGMTGLSLLVWLLFISGWFAVSGSARRSLEIFRELLMEGWMKR